MARHRQSRAQRAASIRNLKKARAALRRNPKRRIKRRTKARKSVRRLSLHSAGARLAYKKWHGNPKTKSRRKLKRYTGKKRTGSTFKRKGRRYRIAKVHGVRVVRPVHRRRVLRRRR